jgi:hypothetical protein
MGADEPFASSATHQSIGTVAVMKAMDGWWVWKSRAAGSE